MQKLVQQFPEEEYYVSRDAALQAYGAESLFNGIDLNSGWKIDFIIRKSRPFSLEEFGLCVRGLFSSNVTHDLVIASRSFHDD